MLDPNADRARVRSALRSQHLLTEAQEEVERIRDALDWNRRRCAAVEKALGADLKAAEKKVADLARELDVSDAEIAARRAHTLAEAEDQTNTASEPTPNPVTRRLPPETPPPATPEPDHAPRQ